MKFALLILLESYILLVMFWAVMALQWRWKYLPLDIKLLAIPCVLIAVTLDVVFNYTVGTILFLKLPAKGEYTFSQRIGSYKRRVDWREKVASFICKRLDVFEVDGSHCKNK